MSAVPAETKPLPTWYVATVGLGALLSTGFVLLSPFGFITSIAVGVFSVIGLRRTHTRGTSIILWITLALACLGVVAQIVGGVVTAGAEYTGP